MTQFFIRWRLLLIAVFPCFCAFAANAFDTRFSLAGPPRAEVKIAAELTAENRLLIKIGIPAGSYLYAEKIQLQFADGITAELVDGNQPVEKKDDPLPVFVGDIELQYQLRSPVNEPFSAPLLFDFSFQECTALLCYLPTTKTLIAERAIDNSEMQTIATTAAKNAIAAVTELPVKSPVNESVVPAAMVAQWREIAELFEVENTITGYVAKDDFIAFLHGTDRTLSARLQQWQARYGLFMVALLLLPLGALLNLTPCVLPMIPINLAIIIGVDKNNLAEKKTGFLIGAAYGAGMAAVYGGLGILAAVAGSRFGALNSSPYFNFALAIIFIALALAMFDLWELDFSRWGNKLNRNHQQLSGGKKKIGAVFLLGGLTALLAGACVAPALTWTLALAADLAAARQYAGLLLPLMLGIGLGAPYPFLTAGIAHLPKPGRWMNRVKQFFGILIFAVALYYGYLGAKLWHSESLVKNFAGETGGGKILSGWRGDLIPALQTALAKNSPVLINFTTQVCKSCDAMKATTLVNPEVTAAMRQFVKVETVVDDSRNPLGTALIEKYRIIGAPTYLILRARTK